MHSPSFSLNNIHKYTSICTLSRGFRYFIDSQGKLIHLWKILIHSSKFYSNFNFTRSAYCTCNLSSSRRTKANHRHKYNITDLPFAQRSQRSKDYRRNDSAEFLERGFARIETSRSRDFAILSTRLLIKSTVYRAWNWDRWDNYTVGI